MTTKLCELAYKYGTDKCPQLRHSYTPFYYELLKDRRQSIKKVLEMGIGYFEGMPERLIVYDNGLKRDYYLGASLYMWRDFFPNAQIYGADILPEVMFKDERIETFLCDERNKDDLINLVKKTGSDIDLFVDDGSHLKRHQIFLCRTVMPLLKRGVIYVIEDVKDIQEVANALNEYDCQIKDYSSYRRSKYGDDKLIIVKNK